MYMKEDVQFSCLLSCPSYTVSLIFINAHTRMGVTQTLYRNRKKKHFEESIAREEEKKRLKHIPIKPPQIYLLTALRVRKVGLTGAPMSLIDRSKEPGE